MDPFERAFAEALGQIVPKSQPMLSTRSMGFARQSALAYDHRDYDDGEFADHDRSRKRRQKRRERAPREPIPATCHPDRPMRARGLCKSCYARYLYANARTVEVRPMARDLWFRQPRCPHTHREHHAHGLCRICYKAVLRRHRGARQRFIDHWATCHSEREHHAHGLCLPCYKNKRAAERRALQEPPVPKSSIWTSMFEAARCPHVASGAKVHAHGLCVACYNKTLQRAKRHERKSMEAVLARVGAAE